MNSIGCAQVLVPEATEISIPSPNPIRVQSWPTKSGEELPSKPLRVQSGIIMGRQLRVPRSIQLELARSVTFGVLGDDSNMYPSSQWVSENRGKFAGWKPGEHRREKPDFVITSLDTRKNNPQPTQLFHIKRINNKPVCNVQSWVSTGGAKEQCRSAPSIHTVSYQQRPSEPIYRVHKKEKDRPIEGIVPLNMKGSKLDIRSEMMLPACDSTNMPSPHNPHTYLQRKRKVPPPYNTHVTNYATTTTTPATSGIVYPNLEHSRMTSYKPVMAQMGSQPFPNETADVVTLKETNNRTSVSCVIERNISRRKFIEAPSSHIFNGPPTQYHVSVSTYAGKKFTRRREIGPPSSQIHLGFDGAVPETSSTKFDDKYLPFIRAKTII